MSSLARIALAAALSFGFASGAMAQNSKASEVKFKQFTAQEKALFDRASGASMGGGNGGNGGDGGGAAGAGT